MMTIPEELTALIAEAKRLYLDLPIILWRQGQGGWWAGKTPSTIRPIGKDFPTAMHSLQRMAWQYPPRF